MTKHFDQDRILNYGSLGNYSLAGFEMILHRYVSHYIITYYLPSGKSEGEQKYSVRGFFSGPRNGAIRWTTEHIRILPFADCFRPSL